MGYHRDPTGWTSRTPQRLVNRIREIRDAHTRRLTSPAPRTMMPNASDPLMTPREYNHRETGSEMPKGRLSTQERSRTLGRIVPHPRPWTPRHYPTSSGSPHLSLNRTPSCTKYQF